MTAIDMPGIRPVIDRTFPLDALAEAFRYLKEGRHVGRICIDVAGD